MVALSNDLASQFAKLLNDGNDKKQKEASMYGTFVESDKKKYVKLDGSELLTPVIQTAAAKDGERVTVTVKNRTAVVTGNLSSPAARSGDVEDLSAKVLSVEELMAKKVSTDELEATIGRIETLETDNATIRDTLTAQSAKIDDLEADNATITGGSVNITSDGNYLAYMTITATNVPTGFGEHVGTVTTSINAGGMETTSGGFTSSYGIGGIYLELNSSTYFSADENRVYAHILETPEAHVTGNLTVSGTINGIRWNWSGQGGQPSWLWGGNDGANMYVYNPSNFSVNYAKSANYANSAGGISAPIYGYDKNVNITCGGWSTPASVTLPAGTYIGMVFAKMYGTPASRMVMVFSTNSGATDAGAYISDDNMDRACCSSPVVINISGNTNFYLRVYNSMSGVRACHCGWYLVKVK